MGTIEFEDRTGPRSIDELREAVHVVEKRIIQVGGSADPELFMQFPIIREGLLELIAIRRKLEELAAEKK